jgi:hypothetical protein
MSKILVTLVCLWISASAQGAEPGWLVGLGEESCGSFLQAIRAHQPTGQSFLSNDGTRFYPESELFQQWLWGYLTASSGNLPPTTDGPGFTAWVKHWCESHADEPFVHAAHALASHLVEKTRSPKEQSRPGRDISPSALPQLTAAARHEPALSN